MAAWVLLPKQCSRVFIISCFSTSATVFPTSSTGAGAVFTPAEVVSGFTNGEGAPAEAFAEPNAGTGDARVLPFSTRFSPVSIMAVSSIASPDASKTARCIVFSNSRTLPRHLCSSNLSNAFAVIGLLGRPLASEYLIIKWSVRA